MERTRINDKYGTRLGTAGLATSLEAVAESGVCAEAAAIYPEDVQLWDLHCSTAPHARPKG